MTPEEIAAARQEFARQVEFCKKARAKHKNVVVEIFQERIEEIVEIANKALDALETSQQAVAQARLNALMEAAKQVCIPCRLGKFKVRVWRGFYRHINDQGHVFQDCDADRIWLLINGANESEGSGE